MAIINAITGFYGFTIDIDPENPSIDSNGEVDSCIIAITFGKQESEVDIVISDGENDFAVKTGDGQIIPCSNPKVIYVNQDNAIVQFTMGSLYPANSPVTLVKVTDSAGFSFPQRTTTRPFEVNAISGHFAYTIEGYKGSNITEPDYAGKDSNTGLVNKVIATVPFTYSVSSMSGRLSDGDDDWGIRMGNGKIIPLKNPEVLSNNRDSFVTLLTMHDGYSYPSNSPGILVRRRSEAGIVVDPVDDDNEFHPVNNIYDVPTNMVSGQTIDLNCARIEPYNASVQNIVWSVISGDGEIVDKHFLHASNGGSIVINGTIENGLTGDDLSNDYHQRFTITVAQNVITKLSDPIPEIKAYVGEIDYTIAVVAESSTNDIHYQWYKNTRNSYDGANAINKANSATYEIPTNLGKGDTYYYCEITSDGAVTVKSKICHIYASVRCTSITIYPLDNMMGWEETRQMRIEQFPSDADLPHVNWFSSNDNIAHFDDTIDSKTGLPMHPGLLISKFPEVRKDGNNLNTDNTVTITAVTTDILGEQLTATIDITLETFVPVEDITGLSLNVNPNNTYNLSATVVPSDATNKKIAWSVSDNNHSDIYISNDVLHVPNTVIPEDHQLGCMIMGTIANGKTPHDKYQKEFEVFIVHGFVPITDIQIVNDTSVLYDAGASISLQATILPTGASIKEVHWDLLSGNAELHGNTLTFKSAGDVKVRVTATKGAGTVTHQIDISREFTFKCSGVSFVPVDDARIIFEHTKKIKVPDPNNPTGYIESEFSYSDNGLDPDDPYNKDGKVALPVVIFPENATNKTVRTELLNFMKKQKPDNYHDSSFEIPENFWTEGWVNDNTLCKLSNNILEVDWSKVTYDTLYQARIKITISEGLSHNTDFVKEETIQIIAKYAEEFIPVQDIVWSFPSKLRCMSPLILEKYNVTPTNASAKNNDTNHIETHWGIEVNAIRDEKGRGGCDAIVLYGTKGEIGFTVDPLPLYQWHLNYTYFYPWAPGKCKLTMTFDDATVPNLNAYNKYYPEKIPFTKEYELEFLPPFIPVTDIIGIASQIYAKQPYILQGEAYSGNGLGCYNPAWDEEDPTNKNIVYQILSSTCGATLTGGNIVNTTGPGTISLKATISEGVAEYVDWYGIVDPQQPVAFEKTFTITVLAEEAEFSRPIVTLTLQDGSTVSCTKLGEVLLLCTPDPSSASITIKGATFRKDQVVRADFYENVHNELSVSYNSTTVSSVDFDESDTVIKLLNGLTPTGKEPHSVGWEIISGTGGSITSNDQNTYANLNIDHTQIAVGGSITVKCTVIPKKTDGTADNDGKVERIVEFKKVAARTGAWQPNPNLTSLRNFGRNFINLTAINRIPDEVTGNNCLMSFLQGCSSVNCNIAIPRNVNGDNCLKYFLKDCTVFNSTITIPDTITGNGAMHGFLMGCIHFNRPVAIPHALKGDRCLKRFLYGCKAFNQPLSIPSGVSGYMCMMECLAFCTSFNQPITLPLDVGDISRDDEFYGKVYCGRQLNLMLYEADSFHSEITVPAATALHGEVAERSFSSNNYSSNMISYGVTFTGEGAAALADKFNNNYMPDGDGNLSWPVYTHITNKD